MPGLNMPAQAPGYTLIIPEDPVGLAVAFHAGRDTSHPGFEMRLYTEAMKRNVAVMYVTTGSHFEFLFDDARYFQLAAYIQQALDTLDLANDRLLFSGMSLAGTRAMKFGKWCLEGKAPSGLKPSAVAICDAPLDFIRFWTDGAIAIKYQSNPTSASEASWVNFQLEQNLGGTPRAHPERYRDYSPYFPQMDIESKLDVFSSVALRAYTEPDIHWWMNNRQKSYYGMNAMDAAALIRDLRLIGNERAELITTTEKGFHPDGQRHPHSWSIVDNGELMDWFVGVLQSPSK
ncbi:MAG: hypothetical protein OEM26_15420 [Saprospiraceae bacterium]|nr:hypothetical protein [Saprospiraceae bacterium]